ncbi:hypothetical protein [Desulfovibrio psychrotolerans]|uniref:Tail fiber protein n=1 Tax=Desulfovibrio psychrotolerans TaxID=415242 RepID=A0A7J0BV42_9BACT|nr:hypothetical protein [Desulfovibrio psychrotolerans]GFM37528.1 hypothetical protein DSM19430T_22120 [Desulfovibrio psychrotolerans]
MTVSTMTTVHAYVGDGVQQEWPVLFPFFNPEDVRAIRTGADGKDTVLAYGSEYTVAALENGGRCICPLGSGERLTLFLDLAPVQQIDLSNTGILAPEIIERGFDRLTLIAQQLKEEVGRCVQIGRTSGLTPNELLASIDASVAVCTAAQAASGQSAAGAATARDEAAVSAMASAAAAASVNLPGPAPAESGRGLVVAPEGGWTLGGTAAAKNVGTGPDDVPTNDLIPVPDLSAIWDALGMTNVRMAFDGWRDFVSAIADTYGDATGIAVAEIFARDAAIHAYYVPTPDVASLTTVTGSNLSGGASYLGLNTLANDTGHVDYTFASPRIITEFALTAHATLPERAPKTWTLVGDPAGANVTLLNIVHEGAWSGSEVRKYAMNAEAAAYSTYRLYYVAKDDPFGKSNEYYWGRAHFYEMPAGERDLASIAFTAEAAPAMVRVLIVAETGAMVLNTDLIVEASRDDGTTWSQCSMSAYANYGAPGGPVIYAGQADVSAQPNGTAVRYRIRASTLTLPVIHAVWMQWG